MCIIAVSRKGAPQPTIEQIKTMFKNNPDGAGYMTVKDKRVIIHKGFMDCKDFVRAIKSEHFTEADPVVYHFRISTQAGVNPRMTHPFPLTVNPVNCEKLDLKCSIGLAHNGIIRMTSDFKEKRYSDTAIFITDYMTRLIRDRKDMRDPATIEMIERLTDSKWAIMDDSGEIVTAGHFIESGGILYSNFTYANVKPISTVYNFDDYVDGVYGNYKI